LIGSHGADDNPKGRDGRIPCCMTVIVHNSSVRSGRAEGGPAIIGDDVRERLGVNDVADEVLVRRVAQSGDERALSELYDRYSRLVYGAGIRYLGDRTLAEDLVQDVFTAVWRSAASFDPSRAGFATWMFRITRNRATDLIRRRRARVRTVSSDPPFEPGEEDATGELSRSFDLASALSRISPVHREVLTLAYFHGLSQSEISRRTDTPLGTVKSRTTAALRALRESMLEDEGG
jgi:RNA polymerase sigma-70 factor (ECF subfamily)